MAAVTRAVSVLTSGLLAFAAVALAQRPSPAVRDTPARALQPQNPNAGIRGHVVDIATGRALVKSRVTLSSSSGDAPPVFTDANGAFAFLPLAAGNYTLAAEKTGYARVRYGARTALDPPVEIAVDADGPPEDIVVRLMKGGAIFGHITDNLGDPIVGGEVSLRAIQMIGETPRLVPVARPSAETNDLGEYRIGDLAPGRYFVSIAAAGLGTLAPGTPREWERLSAWGRTFYPGTRGVGDATAITLAPGEEHGAADFSVRPYERAQLRINASGLAPIQPPPQPNTSGALQAQVQVLQAQAQALNQLQLWFFSADDDDSLLNGRTMGLSTGGTSFGGAISVPVQEPGDWTVLLRSGPNAAVEHVHLSDGEDRELDVTLGRPSSISGRVVFDGTSPHPSPAAIQLSVRGAGPDVKIPARLLLPAAVTPRNDGSFVIPNAIGTVEITATAPSGWLLDSVRYAGRDLLDDPIALQLGQDLSDVQVVLTDRVGSVAGHVVLPDGTPASGCTLALFPDERAAAFNQRRMRLVRADQHGQFSIRDVPNGSYRVAAVLDVDASSWMTEEAIGRLRTRSTLISIADRASQLLTLSCAVGQ